MKKLSLLFTLALFACALQAQKLEGSDYKSAIGLRLGTPISATYKHFFTRAGAGEAYAGFQHVGYGYGYNFFVIGAQYLHHFPIGDIDGFKWFVGGGASVQLYAYDNFPGSNNFSSAAFGINAAGGVDYKFANIPLNLSADWMPTVLIGDNFYNKRSAGGYGGISARYVFR